MKNLQNNLHVEGNRKAKEEVISKLISKDMIEEKVKELDLTVKSLKESRFFIDNHNNEETAIDDKLTFVIFDGREICPIYKRYPCSVNPINTDKDNIPHLSTWSAGGVVMRGNITDTYQEGSLIYRSIEEIDLETFNAKEYYGL